MEVDKVIADEVEAVVRRLGLGKLFEAMDPRGYRALFAKPGRLLLEIDLEDGSVETRFASVQQPDQWVWYGQLERFYAGGFKGNAGLEGLEREDGLGGHLLGVVDNWQQIEEAFGERSPDLRAFMQEERRRLLR